MEECVCVCAGLRKLGYVEECVCAGPRAEECVNVFVFDLFHSPLSQETEGPILDPYKVISASSAPLRSRG